MTTTVTSAGTGTETDVVTGAVAGVATNVGAAPAKVARRVADLVAPSAFGASLGPAPSDLIALTGGSPAASALPAAALSAATAAVLADPRRAARALDYSAHQGHAGLRQWIAERENVSADRVVITNGALHALSLPLLAAVDPGDPVVVENPVYPLVLKVLQLPEAVPVPFAVDSDGLDVDALDRALRDGFRPRAVYVVPDFHNPTGRTLSAPRRAKLVELAEHYGFLVISDNPYAELRGAGERLPDLDVDSDRVVHANTFSKTLGPGLRLGWAVVPQWLVPGVLDLRARLDQHASSLIQEVVAELVGTPGVFDALTADARALYRERAVVLVEALRAEFGSQIDVELPAGGLFAWPRFTDDQVNVNAVAAQALALGVAVIPGGQFASGPGTDAAQHLRLSFGQNDPARLTEAVARLGQAYRTVQSSNTVQSSRTASVSGAPTAQVSR